MKSDITANGVLIKRMLLRFIQVLTATYMQEELHIHKLWGKENQVKVVVVVMMNWEWLGFTPNAILCFIKDELSYSAYELRSANMAVRNSHRSEKSL